MPGAPLVDLVTAVTGRYGHIRNRRHTFQLGPVALPTKGAARELVRTILHGSMLETPLPDDYVPLLLALLSLHPRKAEKLQHGCQGFFVRINPPAFTPKDRGFWIITERPPPREVSFSYRTCFGDNGPAESEAYRRLNEAARAAIMESQFRFKADHFVPGMLCPRGCGTALTLDSTQVDHVDPKFRDILAAFYAQFAVRMPPEALEHRPTYGWRFVNPHDARFFADFHDARATGRALVCATCNIAAERQP